MDIFKEDIMRNNAVSIAKGIGISLMVLGHAGSPEYMRSFIYVFHMPLFFFLSGYCFKDKYLSLPREYFIKRIKGLYLPYVKYSILFLFLHNLFFMLNIYNDEYGFNGGISSLYSLQDYLIKLFDIFTRMGGHDQLLGGFWFLKELLFASFLSFAIIRMCKYVKWWGVVLLIIVVFPLRWTEFRIPFWGINWLTILSATFFLMGYYMRKIKIIISYIYISVFILLVATCSFFLDAEMSHYTLSSILPCFIGAIAGCIATIQISERIAQMTNFFSNRLIFIGEKTMPILVWHFLCFKFVSLVIITIYGLPIERLAEFPVIDDFASKGWWIAYFVVGVVVSLMFNKLEKLIRNLY